MTATIRDEDTAFLGGADQTPRIGHFYLDVSTGQLHSLNETARALRIARIPLLANDESICDLCHERGAPVTAAELPLPLAARDGTPVEAEFLLNRAGQLARRIQYSVTPLKQASGRVGAILATVVCHAPAPDWATMAGLAHDLRTPLQSLQMMRHVLEFRSLPEAQRQEALERFSGAADRTLQIAQDLLEWCRTRGAKTQRSRREWFALEPVLVEVLGEQRTTATEKGLTLDATLGAIHGWQILTDRSRFARIVANLLVNAVRYTPIGGHVNLGAAWEHQGGTRVLVLDVHDTGVGISLKEQESIFHPFERGQGGRDGDSSGSGVGLSVVDRLTAELGLRCDLTSTAGEGSRFRINVPAEFLRMAPAELAGRPNR